MTTIQVQIQDDLVQELGLRAVEQLLEDELVYQQFKLLENRIQSAMHQTQGMSWETEFENARQQAYEEYRQKRQPAQ